MKLNNLNDLMKASFKVRDGVRDGSYEIPTKEMRILVAYMLSKGTGSALYIEKKSMYAQELKWQRRFW